MVKRKKKIPQKVSCGWKNCGIECADNLALNEHIEEVHLNKLRSNKNGRFSCVWNGCKFYTECNQEIKRHVFYHGYYSGLLTQGKYECDANTNVPACAAPTRECEIVPDLKEDYSCEWKYCDRKFASIVEFQEHIVQHALFEYEITKSPDNLRPKIKCCWTFCEKQLDNRVRLLEHICMHSKKKTVACYNCGEVFRTTVSLFDHLHRQPANNTHEYQCAQCFKFFASEKLLKAHVVKHINSYKCSMCDMSCSSPSSLATHIRYRHLKDKPFKCVECDHRFVRQNDLLKHIQFVHSKQVHRCQQPGCKYKVRSYNLLRRHFLEVHENTPYVYICHCCDKLFKNSKYLTSHLIKKHECQLPSGHKRFTYRIDKNGLYRLETMRIECLEMKLVNPLANSTDLSKDSSCYEIVSKTCEQTERVFVSNDAVEAQLVGEVVISLPKMETDD